MHLLVRRLKMMAALAIGVGLALAGPVRAAGDPPSGSRISAGPT
jgi:hypothetical protein